MRVIIIGRTEVLYNSVIAIAEKHVICGIITAKASPEYSKDENDFKELARALKCPFLFTNSINLAARQFIQDCGPDIGVSVNWVSVIQPTVFEIIPFGILNCHPGDLPKYRGNAVCNWAMLNGDDKIVVSIHEMTPGELDSGDIYVQESFTIDSATTITAFVKFWETVTPGLFLQAINGIASGKIRPKSQKDFGIEPFRCYPRLPIDSKIDWNDSAINIHNLIRASAKPYSGAYTYLKVNDEIKKVIIWESTLISTSTRDMGTPGHIVFNDKHSGESHVFTGAGILGLGKLQYENEEVFQPGLIFKSIRIRFGIDIEYELMLLRKYLHEKLR